ncbi:MAG TPA: tetratricopeptide repeat protein [Chloroflexota bacterium]|nr:tetratricopeptide repeat protein [Chloroflexota bacterium]
MNSKEEGLRLIKAGEYDEAARILDQVVETDPQDAQAFLYLGVAYAEGGKKAESIAAFEQCVSVKPSTRGHYNLGLAYESVERLGEAMTQFENAARLDPSYQPALEAIERLKKQGIEARESTVQWTIGAQSVGQAMASAQAQTQVQDQTEQVLIGQKPPAAPGGYTPGSLQSAMQGPKPGGPGPYLPGQLEAEKEAKIRAHQAQMLKSGLIYGAVIGAIARLAGQVFFGLIAPTVVIANCLAGAFFGAIIGAACGYTGGGDETGSKVGAVLFALLAVVSGLIQHADIVFIIIPALVNAVIGFFVGGYIGKMVAQSIGWD